MRSIDEQRRDASRKEIVWLHMSDLHLCEPKSGWDVHRVLKGLVGDLKKMEKDFGLTPQLVFFTGDAAFGQLGNGKGESLKEQFDDAQTLLESVRKSFRTEVPLENLFLVPGNHDIDRGETTPEQGEWPDRQKDAQGINELIRKGGKQWVNIMARLGAYRAFLERHKYQHLLTDPQRLVYAQTREISGVRVGIAGLNSAWSCCRDQEKGRLWLGGDWQMGQAIRSPLWPLALIPPGSINRKERKERKKTGALISAFFAFFAVYPLPKIVRELPWVAGPPAVRFIQASAAGRTA